MFIYVVYIVSNLVSTLDYKHLEGRNLDVGLVYTAQES